MSGHYVVRYQLEQSPGRQRGRRATARTTASQLRLDDQPVAVPDPNVVSSVQFGALIQLPGYTRAPRGRTAQSAVWFPVPGDSIVVQFTSAQGAQVQLRGALRGRTLSGDVWYLSDSGAGFQLGTFNATRSR